MHIGRTISQVRIQKPTLLARLEQIARGRKSNNLTATAVELLQEYLLQLEREGDPVAMAIHPQFAKPSHLPARLIRPASQAPAGAASTAPKATRRG